MSIHPSLKYSQVICRREDRRRSTQYTIIRVFFSAQSAAHKVYLHFFAFTRVFYSNNDMASVTFSFCWYSYCYIKERERERALLRYYIRRVWCIFIWSVRSIRKVCAIIELSLRRLHRQFLRLSQREWPF